MNNASAAAQQVVQVAQTVEHQTMLMVLGITGLLALAVMVVPLATRLRLPFTVMLAAIGVLV